LITIQAKNEFFRDFAPAMGETLVVSDDLKPALLQHPDGPEVVRSCPRENWPIPHQLEHLLERLRRQSFSPELPSQPIGDFQVPFQRKTRDVTRHVSSGYNRPVDILRRIQNLIPVGVEGRLVLSVFRDKGGHFDRFRVELMPIESLEIRRLDFPERDTFDAIHWFARSRSSETAAHFRAEAKVLQDGKGLAGYAREFNEMNRLALIP
jgi:hypothetical protein